MHREHNSFKLLATYKQAALYEVPKLNLVLVSIRAVFS